MHHTVLDGYVRGRDFGPSLRLQLGQQLFPNGTVIGVGIARGSSIVMASARTRFARLTIPTSLPSRTTGTRLIRFVSSRRAMSATGSSR